MSIENLQYPDQNPDDEQGKQAQIIPFPNSPAVQPWEEDMPHIAARPADPEWLTPDIRKHIMANLGNRSLHSAYIKLDQIRD